MAQLFSSREGQDDKDISESSELRAREETQGSQSFAERYTDLLRSYVTNVLPGVFDKLSSEDQARARQLQADTQIQTQTHLGTQAQVDTTGQVQLLQLKLKNVQDRYAKQQKECPEVDKSNPQLYFQLEQNAQEAQNTANLILPFTELAPSQELLADKQMLLKMVQTLYNANIPFKNKFGEKTVEDFMNCLKTDTDAKDCLGQTWPVLESTVEPVYDMQMYLKECAENAMVQTPQGINITTQRQREMQEKDIADKAMNDMCVKLVASFFAGTSTTPLFAFIESFQTFQLSEQVAQLAEQVQQLNPDTSLDKLNEFMNLFLGIPNLFSSMSGGGLLEELKQTTLRRTQPAPVEPVERTESGGVNFLEQLQKRQLRAAVDRPHRVQQARAPEQPLPATPPKNTLQDWVAYVESLQQKYKIKKAEEIATLTEVATLNKTFATPEFKNRIRTYQSDVAPFKQFKNQYGQRQLISLFQNFPTLYMAYCANEQAKKEPEYFTYIKYFADYHVEPNKETDKNTTRTPPPFIPPEQLITLKRVSATIKSLFKGLLYKANFYDKFFSDKLENCSNFELRALYTVLQNDIVIQGELGAVSDAGIVRLRTYLRDLFTLPLPCAQPLDENIRKKCLARQAADDKARTMYTLLTPVGVFNMLPKIELKECPLTAAEKETREALEKEQKRESFARTAEARRAFVAAKATIVTGGAYKTPEDSLLKALHPRVEKIRRERHAHVPRDPLLYALYMSLPQ